MSAMLAKPADRLAVADTPRTQQTRAKKRIVIIGGGFAGIAAARALKRADAEVVLIDRRNHHIFQPLLYQAATAVLAPSEIAAPIRRLAVKQRNLTVALAEVTGIDLHSRSLDATCPELGVRKVPFDFLVVATGMRPSYFGHDELGHHSGSILSVPPKEGATPLINGIMVATNGILSMMAERKAEAHRIA